jgi:hypothetical protein
MQRETPCDPKMRRFKTKESAKAASVAIAVRHGIYRQPYPCSKCNGWHLSPPK